ncbi:hypothetical protein OA326_01870 [Candidatus Pelagibacter sp.]|nr:hypothetical protein [Candidatus Pelagibacter sp.]
MYRYIKIILTIIIFISVTSCTANKSYTNITKNFRQVDIINSNKQIVKTYYQSFNNKIYEWLVVTCYLPIKRFYNVDSCEIRSPSKLLIKNKESNATSYAYNSNNDANQKNNNSYNYNNSNNNENNNNGNENNDQNFLPGDNPTPRFDNCNDPQKC